MAPLPLAGLVIALVLTVQGEQIKLDKGLIDGVRPGDAGEIYYELSVDDRTVAIEVGQLEVTVVTDDSSSAEVASEIPVRPGFQVRLRTQPQASAPDALLRIANQRIEEGQLHSALQYFLRLKESFPNDSLVQRQVERLQSTLVANDEVGFLLAAAEESIAAGNLDRAAAYSRRLEEIDHEHDQLAKLKTIIRNARTADMVLIKAGTYTFGRDPEDARFYNQVPRFQKNLSAFRIDRHPISRSEFSGDSGLSRERGGDVVVGVTFLEAQEYCRGQGKRLPSEFEWAVAVSQNRIETENRISEWTHSWYEAYPGNHRPEEEYGREYRVIRGFDAEGELSPETRFFMHPEERAADVGFRCALGVQ